MNRISKRPCFLCCLASFALVVGPILPAGASETESAVETDRRVHEVTIRCDDEADEECQHKNVRIQIIGDGDDIEEGDHGSIWIGDGSHGYHFLSDDGLGPGGFLGVQIIELTTDLRQHFGVPEDAGVLVGKVMDDSPAFRAGLTVGDIVTRLDGEAVGSADDFRRLLYSRDEGEVVTLEVWRDGSLQSLDAVPDVASGRHAVFHTMFRDCGEDADCLIHGDRYLHFDAEEICPDSEDCEIDIDCRGDDCFCTRNGVEIDCGELHESYDTDS